MVEYKEKIKKTEIAKKKLKQELKRENRSKSEKLLQVWALKEEKIKKWVEEFKKRAQQEEILLEQIKVEWKKKVKKLKREGKQR